MKKYQKYSYHALESELRSLKARMAETNKNGLKELLDKKQAVEKELKTRQSPYFHVAKR